MRRREELRCIPRLCCGGGRQGVPSPQQGPRGPGCIQEQSVSDTHWTFGSTTNGSWNEPTTCTWNSTPSCCSWNSRSGSCSGKGDAGLQTLTMSSPCPCHLPGAGRPSSLPKRQTEWERGSVGGNKLWSGGVQACSSHTLPEDSCMATRWRSSSRRGMCHRSCHPTAKGAEGKMPGQAGVHTCAPAPVFTGCFEHAFLCLTLSNSPPHQARYPQDRVLTT